MEAVDTAPRPFFALPPTPSPPIPLGIPPLTPLLSAHAAPSFHPLPSPPPPARRRRRSRASTDRDGPGRAGAARPTWISCTNCNVVAAALPGGVAAGAAGRRASTAALACAVPRARRSRTRAAGGARGGRSAKLIKVYTRFTRWFAGAKKGFLTVYLQFTNNGERFAL